MKPTSFHNRIPLLAAALIAGGLSLALSSLTSFAAPSQKSGPKKSSTVETIEVTGTITEVTANPAPPPVKGKKTRPSCTVTAVVGFALLGAKEAAPDTEITIPVTADLTFTLPLPAELAEELLLADIEAWLRVDLALLGGRTTEVCGLARIDGWLPLPIGLGVKADPATLSNVEITEFIQDKSGAGGLTPVKAPYQVTGSASPNGGIIIRGVAGSASPNGGIIIRGVAGSASPNGG